MKHVLGEKQVIVTRVFMCVSVMIVLTLLFTIPLRAFRRDTSTPREPMCHGAASGDLSLDRWLWSWKRWISILFHVFSFYFYISHFPWPSSSSPLLFWASRVFSAAGFTDMCLPTTGWRTLITQSSSVQIFQTVFISDLNHWKLQSISYSWKP